MDALSSMFYADESLDSLKLKLLHTKLKLISTKNFTMQMLNLLQHVSEDRDRITHQLHRTLQFHRITKTMASTTTSYHPHQGFVLMTPSKASTTSYHHHHQQQDLVIQRLVKGKVLPEKGKLLESVMKAGPLLHTLLVAGPLPTWRNPPLPRPINVVPAFTVKDRPNVADPHGVGCSDSWKYQVLASKRQRLH